MSEDTPTDTPDASLSLPDDPEWDGTDAAHPAWWRGQEYGVNGTVARLRRVLDGLDDGAGVIGNAGLERVRRDVLALKASEAKLAIVCESLLGDSWFSDERPNTARIIRAIMAGRSKDA